MGCIIGIIISFVVGLIIGYNIGKKPDNDSGNATGFDVTVGKPVPK